MTLHNDVTTSTEEGRRLFEAGLAQLLNFHHEAAIAAFTQALKDEGVAPMANWGIAAAIGPHYNMPCGLGSGYPAISAAMEKLDSGITELEKDLIRAMAKRSSKESHEAVDPSKMFFGTTDDENRAYADAMKKMATKYPENIDVKCLYVESLMNLNPWNLWNKDKGTITATDPTTLEIVELLEDVLATDVGKGHPGIIHLYIHAMELSPTPEKALEPANALRTLMPDYGHLVHMPSHIDAWVGHYEDAILANIAGVKADDQYVAVSGVDAEFYKFYRCHNIHFIIWMAMFDGQSKVALKYADELIKLLPAGDEKSGGVQFMLGGVVPMGKVFLEAFCTMKYHVWIRFGMWDELLSAPLPSPPDVFAASLATAHYARGIAYASTSRVPEAEKEQDLFLDAMKAPALEGRVYHNNPYYVDDGSPCIFGVAEKMLNGEIAYRKKDYDTAFTHLRDAVNRDDNLHYDEPWAWMLPTRHALGALLLEQGYAMEAADVYRQDLEKYPKNMWALFGLHKCLAAGAPSKPDDGDVSALFKAASKRADVKFEHTCFCAGVQEAKA